MFNYKKLILPEQFSINFKIAKNIVRQIFSPSTMHDFRLEKFKIKNQDALIATRPDNSQILIVRETPPKLDWSGDILKVNEDLDENNIPTRKIEGKWLHISSLPKPSASTPQEAQLQSQLVRESWKEQFFYHQENWEQKEKGLRTPQLGALYATLSHWTVNPTEPATIVMPTGTGKTETMLALLVNQRLPCLLVIVPTNALREQIANKFLSLGVLKSFKVIGEDVLYPIVGIIKHQFPDSTSIENFLYSCNVVITTMQAINACSDEVRRKLCKICSHLIIDEAHHVKAPKWDKFRQDFYGKPILQFTATPFRNDGKQLGGKIIYSYPLSKAQQEGYFKPILFRPTHSFIKADLDIANKAIEQLKLDINDGLDHLIMARVNTVIRAEEILKIYQEIAPQYNPITIHHEMSRSKQNNILSHIHNRISRIIVCVDMLGEGFDLPNLKIAAIHDIHKSLAITLQFIGRFTRSIGINNTHIGDASIIVNRAEVTVQKQLRALYAEDADWNQVIRILSEGATAEEEERFLFNQSFSSLPKEVPIQSIQPKMSTVVYRSKEGNWDPEKIETLFPQEIRYTKNIGYSMQNNIIWFITQEFEETSWCDIQDMRNIIHHIYILHWDENKNLLFINSSNNKSLHESLAKIVCGEKIEIIKGDIVYRAMHNIKRMIPTNLGLLDLVSRTRRFMMLVGADTTEGLDPSQSKSKTKTNLFGFGFENGERVSIGCSLKGRIWSYLVAQDLSSWIKWCQHIGAKLIDDSITTDEIFKNFVKPIPVKERPNLIPLAIEWPLDFLEEQEKNILVSIGNKKVPFFEVGLDITNYTRNEPICFRLTVEENSAEYQISFTDQGMIYSPKGEEVIIYKGKHSRNLSQWFQQSSPKIYFEQDVFIEHGLLMRMDRDIPSFDLEKFETWQWSNIDIKKESQGLTKQKDSIQYHTIQQILNSPVPWHIVFDDDDSREVADIVAIRIENNRLIIHLYHCKYSRDSQAGSRIDDLYAVCGQAQKSIYWRENRGLSQLIPHLIKRESNRLARNQASRIELGSLKVLQDIEQRRETLRPEFKIFIVQPGLSKAQANEPILKLLSATSLFLLETFNIDFGVIASP